MEQLWQDVSLSLGGRRGEGYPGDLDGPETCLSLGNPTVSPCCVFLLLLLLLSEVCLMLRPKDKNT